MGHPVTAHDHVGDEAYGRMRAALAGLEGRR